MGAGVHRTRLKEAITALAAISARHAAGEVQSPGGLLRKMVELHQAGGLRLDRTLFGLVDKLNGNKRRGAGTEQGCVAFPGS